MSHWEREYRDAVAGISSPDTLDARILQQARRFKPVKVKSGRRWLSGAASSFTVVAVVVLLAHPAQYIDALTPSPHRANGIVEKSTLAAAMDPWHQLRIQVKAGNLAELCRQWSRQKHRSSTKKMPQDLEDKARTHCRVLP